MKTVGLHLRAFPIPSEAFVIEQARTLTRYRPVLLVRQLLQSNSLECRDLSKCWSPKLARKLFSVAPGAWAWGGAKQLADLDLLHAHFGPNGAYAIPIANKLKVPLVVTYHGFDATLQRKEMLFNQGIYGLYYILNQRRLQRKASKVIAVSKYLASRLIKLGFSSEQIEQHYIGVDIEKFFPIPIEQRTRDIVCVARLTPAKGITDLIEAFARVSPELPSTNLRLIGTGAARSYYEKLTQERGIAEQVVFEGSMSQDKVAAIVRNCALSVLASKTGDDGWQEAFGLASIEAAASGLPVIVTKHGGLLETIVDQETGLAVPEGNVQELSACILEIMRNDATRQRMGEAGRRRVTQQFELHQQTAKLEAIYDYVTR